MGVKEGVPTKVLVNFPDPDKPKLVACWLHERPRVGDEFPDGYIVRDHKLESGDSDGEEFAYEVWVEPLTPELRDHRDRQ
jgi:hypothetical protein